MPRKANNDAALRGFESRPLQHTHQDTATVSFLLPGTANPYKGSVNSADTRWQRSAVPADLEPAGTLASPSMIPEG